MISSKKILIISISSDIGTALAKHYVNKGFSVAGTYRTASSSLNELAQLGVNIFPCDLLDDNSTDNACKLLENWAGFWDALIICPGTLDPISKFEDAEFSKWEKSLKINFIAPMRVVRKLLPSRNITKRSAPTVLFFAGGGSNSAPNLFSAYTVSKIALTKMCELLDAEQDDTKFVIIGPGWVRTKIHETTLAAGEEIGLPHQMTVERLEKNQFVSMTRVVDCCDWAIHASKTAIGGRNISAEHVAWDNPQLENSLIKDSQIYKLRRKGNNLKI